MSDPFDIWGDVVSAFVEDGFKTVSRNPSDHETVIAYRTAISNALRASTSRITPEWCVNMAKLEEAHEVGAGVLGLDPTSDCPHAAPFRYCETCKASPCPIGLGGASGTEARQRTDPEEGLDPKGDGPTLEERDAQTPEPSSRERK